MVKVYNQIVQFGKVIIKVLFSLINDFKQQIRTFLHTGVRILYIIILCFLHAHTSIMPFALLQMFL